jgi:hypothetical protein
MKSLASNRRRAKEKLTGMRLLLFRKPKTIVTFHAVWLKNGIAIAFALDMELCGRDLGATSAHSNSSSLKVHVQLVLHTAGPPLLPLQHGGVTSGS